MYDGAPYYRIKKKIKKKKTLSLLVSGWAIWAGYYVGRAVIGFGGTTTQRWDKKVNNDGVVNNSGATPHSLCNDLNDCLSIFRLLRGGPT